MIKPALFSPSTWKDLLDQLFLDQHGGYATLSYAQEGEDGVLGRFFEQDRPGFYVDVGAHHPKRFSNTYALYRKGWKGINIDAAPGSMHAFRRLRPRDINVEAAVADHRGTLTYYIFNDQALNTFDPDLARARAVGMYRIVSTMTVPVEPLADILARTLPAGQPVDLLTVDVEGLDDAVLRSNDWTRFRPRLVLMESAGGSIRAQQATVTHAFLESQGYDFFGKTVLTLFYVLRGEE